MRYASGHSLIQNHPFVDGNKRIGHCAMEVFLLLNGYEIDASVDDHEKIIIDVASGKVSRIELSEWISKLTKEFSKVVRKSSNLFSKES